MYWTASWIWDSGDPNPCNYYLCLRRGFDLEEGPPEATLHITADTRYVLWVNGERIGYGPVRAFPWHYCYDTYDLSGRLRAGHNALAVLVMHYGIGTFQSLPTRAGLLAQLEIDGHPLIVTDESWRVQRNPAYHWALPLGTPRISCQQGWVEEFHATSDPPQTFIDAHQPSHAHRTYAAEARKPLWWTTEFDDAVWLNATVIGPAGMEPWTELLSRDVPFLTEEPVYPVRVLESRRVRPPGQTWSISLRRNLLPGIPDAGSHYAAGLLAACLVNHHRGPLHVAVRNPGFSVARRLRVNGVDVEAIPNEPPPWDGTVTWRVDLRPGENLLVWDVTGAHNDWTVSLVLEGAAATPRGIHRRGTHITVGPFDSHEDPAFVAVWNAASTADLAPLMESARGVGIQRNPFLSVAYATPLPGAARIDGIEAVCADDENIATVWPDPGGATTEILLDFGRMTVGWWEFEIEAQAGTQIALLGFESIQDGVRDLTWGVNNALSYQAREGWQTFRSVVRRGCRYLVLSVRFPHSEIREWRRLRIRYVRTIESTYPVVERGAFECSDPTLNRIWDMGRLTTRLCCEDTYVDCPTYEQTFWVGDARIQAAANHYGFGEYALTRRSLLLAAESMGRSPITEPHAPGSSPGLLITWSLLWVLACEEYWQATGDRAFVEQVYPYVARQARTLAEDRTDLGLLRYDAWHLMDWAPVDNPPDATVTHTNAWFVESLRRLGILARVLGRDADVEWAESTAGEVKTAANEHLWDEVQRAYRDCLHADGSLSQVFSEQTQIAVLVCGCAPPERVEVIARYVGDPPEGFVRVGSPFTMFFAFEALAKLGRFRQILELTRKWWGMMLQRGATTCWETFPGWEQGARWTRSHCHGWSAAPTYFLSRYQLGIAPLEPGFRRALIAPTPAGLKWARGRVPTPHGEIEVAWEHGDGRFHMAALLAPSVAAEIRLPSECAAMRLAMIEGAERVAGESLRFTAAAGSRIRLRCESNV